MRGWLLFKQLGGFIQCAIEERGKQGSARRSLGAAAGYPDAFVIEVTTPTR